MKCPLFCMNDTRVQLGEETEIGDCLKEECAWWDEAHECCAIIALNQTFVAVGNVIGRAVDKMPHEGQFRKDRR